tara:strand:+ start:358 stop:1902 length:1545 start_codon:yes stop_codon:yes gene_type:complete
MSFWSGLGRAMESNEAQRNVEEARDEREAARAKAEAWQTKTFEYGANRDRLLDERYEDKTLLQQEQYETAQERLNRAETARTDQQSFSNKITMFNLTKDLGGAFGGRGGNASKAKAPSAPDMEAASMNIRSELGGKQGIDNLPRGKREFFETILSDPAAAYGVSAFLQAQRGGKEGNDINIMDLPDYISIAGIIKGKGDPNAAKELRDMIMAGDGNIANMDKLMNGLSGLEEYDPMQVVWSQTKAIKDFPSQEKDFETFQSVLRKQAIAAYNKIPAAERQTSPLHEALNKLENDNETTQDRGFDDLFNLMGADLAEEMGLRDNVIIKPYFAVIDASRKAREQERAAFAEESLKSPSMVDPSSVEDSQSLPNNPTPSFTEAEFNDFLVTNPDFSGTVIVDGNTLTNKDSGPVRNNPEGLGRAPSRDRSAVPGMDSADVREATANVPAEVKGAVESIVEENNPEAIEGAISELTEEYGADVAAVLFKQAGYQPTVFFDDAKSGRGTGKAAMLSGLK